MKKIFYCMMAMFMTTLVFSACSSDDDPVEEIAGSFTYTEPLCDWGSGVDDVKDYMASLPKYQLTAETSSSLIYTSSENASVVSYNFTVIGLFSAQVTVDTKYQSDVVKALQSKYQQTTTGSESDGNYFFYPADKSTSITTGKVEGYFFVNYVRVTK